MTLPLFTLNTVLFPGCNLDLQVFEARYLDMIGRCMKQGGGFGVVCILEGEQVGRAPESFAGIGCQALIEDFQQQDNGLLGIRVEGERRFMVDEFEVRKDNLLVADVRAGRPAAGRGRRGPAGAAQRPGRAPDGVGPGHGQRNQRQAGPGQSTGLPFAIR